MPGSFCCGYTDIPVSIFLLTKVDGLKILLSGPSIRLVSVVASARALMGSNKSPHNLSSSSPPDRLEQPELALSKAIHSSTTLPVLSSFTNSMLGEPKRAPGIPKLGHPFG